MDSLPNELLDLVVAQVASADKVRPERNATDLAHCCLVSKRFFEAAQTPLYTRIHVEVMSDEPTLLLGTLKANVQLAKAVKELYIQSAAPTATPAQQVLLLRDFLEESLPLCRNLAAFRSDHRIVTLKLVETALYSKTGYSMSVPTELGNIRTLELFAADYIFKYNYILRLPRVEKVVLYSAKIIDLDGDDNTLPSDWGWTSQSIKELEIHQGFRNWNPTPSRMRRNSLQALARSVPLLERLRLYHYECALYPTQSRQLLAFFTSQLRKQMHVLSIQDGRIDARHPELGHDYLTDDGSAVLDDIKESNLQSLSIDLHILCTTIRHLSLHEAIDAVNLPPTLRYLNLRHVEVNDASSVTDTGALLNWDRQLVVQQIARKCPALAGIDLELRLLRKPHYPTIQGYRESFASIGIVFNVLVHNYSASRRRSSIICSSTSPNVVQC